MSNANGNGVVEAFKAAAATCPLPPAIDLIGEKWTILILRGSMTGLCHFEEFQAGLGIARNILSDRLAKLVAGGLLSRETDGFDRRKIVYALTRKGRDLLPVMVALRQWAQKYGHGYPPGFPVDRLQGKPVRQILVQAEDGRELTLEDLNWVDVGGTMPPFEGARTAA